MIGGTRLSTTDVYTSSQGGFSPGPPLMNNMPRGGACLAQIDSGSFVITGGGPSQGVGEAVAFSFDVATSNWTNLTPMNVARHSHMCGHFDGNLF